MKLHIFELSFTIEGAIEKVCKFLSQVKKKLSEKNCNLTFHKCENLNVFLFFSFTFSELPSLSSIENCAKHAVPLMSHSQN